MRPVRSAPGSAGRCGLPPPRIVGAGRRLDAASESDLGGRAGRVHAGAVPPSLAVTRRALAAGLVGGLVLAALGGCGAAPARARPTTGAIAGLARDHDSGDPVARAEIRVRGQGELTPRETRSSDHGLYDIDHLPAGRYQLAALFAGQPIDVTNIEVRSGETTFVDLVFTLGRPDPIRVNYGDPTAAVIDRYRPRDLDAAHAIIEGTVNDTQTRERVAGAVVTAVAHGDTEQTITDDQGRYKFPGLRPGTYAVSAYYSISGRGQIEVRRGDITVAGAEAVIVPLWIEMLQ